MFANREPCCPRGRIDPHPDLPPCAGCGRCCHLVVELRPGDVVPEEFVVEHNGARCMDQRGNGACVALDSATLLCTIYADRPQTCRDFNRGESLCRRILAAGPEPGIVGLSLPDSPPNSRMTFPKILPSLLCSLALAVTALAAGQHTKGEKPLSISQGQKVELADFLVTGKVTLFDFTSEYCEPCRAYADPLLKLHQQRGGLAVVKVDINRPEYHQIDWDSPVAQQFALSGLGLPHFKIYGPDGKLVTEGRDARQLVNQWLAALE